jgi:hypothetical protein
MKSNDELIDRHRATAAAERKVIEAAKAARLPIEAYIRARGVPNDTIMELVVRVEDLEATEGGGDE